VKSINNILKDLSGINLFSAKKKNLLAKKMVFFFLAVNKIIIHVKAGAKRTGIDKRNI